MYLLLRRLLFCLPPETAHTLTLTLLKWVYRPCVINYMRDRLPQHPTAVWGLNFPNPIGLAAGLDKNGDYIDALFGLGFGFIEVGCVTPKPQAGNPLPRVFRIPQANALINRMGFNNKGIDYLVQRLQQRKVAGIVGVNIGKNRDTAVDNAVNDYCYCLERVYPYADFVTVNISSPNTPGLRELATGGFFSTLLEGLVAKRTALVRQYEGRKVPLLIKLTVDFTEDQVKSLIDLAIAQGIDGIIASNTTVDHSSVEHCRFGLETGGLSGLPLRDRVAKMVTELQTHAQGKLPIIAVGGILTPQDAVKDLALGACLLQIYTGLIYKGPGLIKQILNHLTQVK